MTYPSSVGPVVPPPHEGYRRRFTEADKHRILGEAAQPGASLAQIARRHGIAGRVLCRWKQELASPTMFVTLEITDETTPAEEPVS
ncbi:transposase [Xanthobacter sp. V3C-3]|uniref:transposase n=1 Tax=Xanthobacter lutulentifluminis TaxID=3119935 RepID=UPI0037299F40